MMKVRLQQFSGPLDLLLKLIEKEELDITEISIAKIADQYIEHIENSPAIQPEEMADFLVLAARLLLIKSKALFPYLEIARDEDAEELERQLRMYKEFVDASKKIQELIGSKKFMFIREFNRKAILAQFKKFSPPPLLTSSVMAEVMQELVERIKPLGELEEKVIIAGVSIEEKIAIINQSILARVKISFSRILSDSSNPTDVIVSFLAVLELIKQRVVTVEQGEMFGEIEICALEVSGLADRD
jgi:segregation and condensation protein A